jgi:uncharacterized protein
MSVSVHPSAGYARQRWRNGGGWTNEIARSVADETTDDWTWRVSIAEIDTDGPFSPFPGVDRVLVLLNGDGVGLAIDGTHHELREQYAHIQFAGEAVVHCSLVNGPTRDFNVMWRRSATQSTHVQVFLRMLGGVFSITALPGELWVMHLLADSTVAGPGLPVGATTADTVIVDAVTSVQPIRQSLLGTGTALLIRVSNMCSTAPTSGRL